MNQVQSYKHRTEGAYITRSNYCRQHSCFDVSWIDWKPKVIVDVGAFDFGDSIRFKETFPDCRVIGFELLKENFDKFAEIAQADGVETYHCAICDKNGTTNFWQNTAFSKGLHAQSSILEPDKKYKENYGYINHELSSDYVMCFTLKTWCGLNQIENIDFLHIDVEGAEYQVIAGLEDMRPKMIFAEFLLDGGWKGQKTYQELLDLLFSMGYELKAELAHDKLFKLRA